MASLNKTSAHFGHSGRVSRLVFISHKMVAFWGLCTVWLSSFKQSEKKIILNVNNPALSLIHKEGSGHLSCYSSIKKERNHVALRAGLLLKDQSLWAASTFPSAIKQKSFWCHWFCALLRFNLRCRGTLICALGIWHFPLEETQRETKFKNRHTSQWRLYYLNHRKRKL